MIHLSTLTLALGEIRVNSGAAEASCIEKGVTTGPGGGGASKASNGGL